MTTHSHGRGFGCGGGAPSRVRFAAVATLLLFLFSLPWPGTASFARTVLLDFPAESTRGWRSGPHTVQPRSSGERTVFQLDFREPERRITATREGPLDLSRFTSFRFRVGIDHPETILEATLGFKSGAGWYRTGFTLHEPGLLHRLFSRVDFRVEGDPRGWDQIDAVEFAFWPRETGRATLTLFSLDAFVDGLWLVNPEPFARTGDEIYTARVSRRHLRRILSGLGLPHAVVDLRTPPESRSPELLVLPTLGDIPGSVERRLLSLADQGTRFVVMDARNDALATALGVVQGPEVSSSTVGRFDRIRPTPRPHTPSAVYQHSWGFRRIQPAAGSRVTAQWVDARGRETGEPAAVAGPKGVWLNAAWKSGDVPAKQQWMLEWIGAYAPKLLSEAVRFHVETRSPAEMRRKYGPLHTGNPAARHLAAMAETAVERSRRSTSPPRTSGDPVASPSPLHTLRWLRKAEVLMERAIAAAQPAWNADVRGVWDQQGTGFHVGGWDDTCRQLKAAGFNAVFANMATAGRAHYRSSLIPPSKTFEQYGDQLQAFSRAARAHGLQAHAWKICWKLNTRLPAFQKKLEREERLMRNADGQTLPWLSLSDPRNVQFEIDSLLEIARSADLAGLHLDYMRYPGAGTDYGPAARKAFETQWGRPLPHWPREVLGPLKGKYQAFRQQEVHRAMQRISDAVKAEFPDLTLSVAVWGAWPDCADAQGQDWPVWCRNGWVDWVIPMNYTDNPDQFAGWLDLQRAQPGVAERLLPGIGLISTNAELRPVQLLEQLNLIRDRNLPGAVLYRLDSSLPQRVFPFLRIW